MNFDQFDNGRSQLSTRSRIEDPLRQAQDLVINVLATAKLDRSAREKLATATRHMGQAQSAAERVLAVLREPVARAVFITSILAMVGSLVTFVAMLIS